MSGWLLSSSVGKSPPLMDPKGKMGVIFSIDKPKLERWRSLSIEKFFTGSTHGGTHLPTWTALMLGT
jgi:hypothetical protein